MSKGLNKVMLIGNLGRDPEIRYTQSGNAVCNISIAVTERRKKGDNWEDHTEWVYVVCFGRTAENVGQYMAKGRRIFVEGRMQTREWTDKDGNERKSTEVVANDVMFLDSGKGQGAAPSSSAGQRPAATQKDEGLYEDDLPF